MLKDDELQNLNDANANSQKSNWTQFKKQYQDSEKNIKKRLEELQQILYQEKEEQNDQYSYLKNKIKNLINRQESELMSYKENYIGKMQESQKVILQRYLEIVQEQKKQYKHVYTQIDSKIQKRKLFENSQLEEDSHLNQALTQNSKLHGINNQLDNVLSIQSGVGGQLNDQGNRFDHIGNKMNSLTQQFPAINTIADKIKKAKLKREIITSLVIVICLFLFLYLIFKK